MLKKETKIIFLKQYANALQLFGIKALYIITNKELLLNSFIPGTDIDNPQE